MKIFLALLVVFCLFSCSSHKDDNDGSIPLKIVPGEPVVVRPDSLPRFVNVIDKSRVKVVPAGKPRIIPFNNHKVEAGIPRVIPAVQPIIYKVENKITPPKRTSTTGRQMQAGKPEIVAAKDFANKDDDPIGFAYMGKLQGLKHSTILSLLEDKAGNIWIGTQNGVAKFDGKYLSHFGENQGLLSGNIYCMIQDHSGNIWFGTSNSGLTKYDGTTFTHFTEKEGLPSNNILNLMEDHLGNIWIGTRTGLAKFDGATITAYWGGISDPNVWALAEDKKGIIWFGTEDLLTSFDGETFTSYPDIQGDQNQLNPSRAITTLRFDDEGILWIATIGNGFYKYDGKKFSNIGKGEGFPSTTIVSMSKKINGMTWFATDVGIVGYDGKSFESFNATDGLTEDFVNEILEDRKGNVWIATNNGLNKLSAQRFVHFGLKQGLTTNNVSSLFKDSSGLWIGMKGVGYFDGKELKLYGAKEGFTDNQVNKIYKDHSGNLWFGTTAAGVIKFDGKTFTHINEQFGFLQPTIVGITEDAKNNMWFISAWGVYKYDGINLFLYHWAMGLIDPFVINVSKDSKGNLWFSTAKGVNKFDGNTFSYLTKEQGLPHNDIKNVYEDMEKNLWFISEAGVAMYDGKKFVYITEKEGLLNNGVLSILQDKAGNFWFGTRFGISMLTAENLKILIDKKSTDPNIQLFKNYGYEDGFLGIGCMRNVIAETANGTLWFGTNDRLTAFDPLRILTKDTVPPVMQINDINVFNEKIPWAVLDSNRHKKYRLGNGLYLNKFRFTKLSGWNNLPEKLSLAYNNNQLTFNFVGSSQTSPFAIKYKYKLDGIDKTWSALTTLNSAPYGNLPSGKYLFRIKAMNSDGYWSNEITYPFSIRPPWWKTAWMYIVYFLAASALFSYVVWWNGKRQQAKERHQREKAELELQSLRAQLNPHFMFNSLNAIQELILMEENDKSQSYLARFSKLLRMLLENADKPFVPLASELEFLNYYLSLETLRMPDMKFNITIDKLINPNEVFLPNMILQPYIENSIWHGLSHKLSERYLQIRVIKHSGFIHYEIEDNGVGRKKSGEIKSIFRKEHKSKGMELLSRRYGLLAKDFKSAIKIEIIDINEEQNHGTLVRIIVPDQISHMVVREVA